MLEIQNVGMSFGGVVALRDISFAVQPGEVVGVIGPNGSGKSTLVNIMTGFYRPTDGQVTLEGSVISGHSPAGIRRLGVARTFQNLRLVQEMSALDNVTAGTYLDTVESGGMVWQGLSAVIGLTAARRASRRARDAAKSALEVVGMAAKSNISVGNLSYGDQKRLELARAIALRPSVLILDEPTAGMAEDEAEELIGLMSDLAKDGSNSLSLFLVEHRLELVLSVSDRAIVMDGGALIADGVPAEIAVNPDVRRVYVGGE
ncbi:ABC transporter ATP-binding protein [Rhodococcus fascians]|nr:ABC transporter ATP-binding protein [Rhodococcus fascians]MBY4238355.1 ABC transporter ATP-binding protein [Rhodococcus fascians]MBY4254264.1 ABC transporter ATP-binding protein [Rhodococcus fascians]MBY4269645.1 ABC transporter ATP-binding protein [Rhodococcus fascians]